MSNYSELTLYQLTEGLSESLQDPNIVDDVCYNVYDNLMQEVLLDIIFEIHYTTKTENYTFHDDHVLDNQEKFVIVNEIGLDIFGEHAKKKDQYCNCPCCNTKICSVKLAKHLEECMGLVIRKSSRLAQRGGTTNSNSSYSGNGDDGYDSDCVERGKKKSLRNSSSKKSKNGRSSKSSNRHTAGEVNQFSNIGDYVVAEKEDALEYMTIEERRNMLRRICGVVSEHTKKLCTRTAQCPQHTPEQKRAVREALIDQYEYMDLNEGDYSRSVSVSPADSGSNSNSGSVQGRKKEKPQRGRPPKTRRGSPSSPIH